MAQLNIDEIPPQVKTIAIHILIAAKFNVVKQFNTDLALSLSETTDDHNRFCALEKMLH